MDEQFNITVDDCMEEFISDMAFADDELSDSIWTCVDNFIDAECIKMMDSENSLFETDRDGGASLPFNYILDKVMEKVDTVEDIASASYGAAFTRGLTDEYDKEVNNKFDPDYCEDVNFNEITPEDFQLFISKSNGKEAQDDSYTLDNESDAYDSIFNA